MATADFYYPDRECLVNFLQSWVEKLLAWPGIEPTTKDLSSQSGAFDHSATARAWADI